MKRLIYLPLAMLLTMLAASCESYIERQDEMTTGKPDNSYYISIDEAEATLNNMLRGAGRAITKSAYNISSRYAMPVAAHTKSGQEPSNIYVFNFGDDEGFAIMSGDKRVEPLLALAEAGSLAPGDTIANNGMYIYLACLENYYQGKINSPDTTSIEIYDDLIAGNWEFDYKEMRYGNCQVKWGQSKPYNKYCFTDNGEEALTSCTATAIAQLMSIFRYPSEYNGYRFNWDEMLKYRNIKDLDKHELIDPELPPDEGEIGNPGDGGIIIGIPDTDTTLNTAKDHIARLMQQIGLPENMNITYGTDVSTASLENSIRTLFNFGYHFPGIYKGLDGERITEENKTIVLKDVIEDLKEGYPCLVKGTLLVDTLDYRPSNTPITGPDPTENTLNHMWLIHGLLTLKAQPNTDIPVNIPEIIEKHYVLCNFGENGLYDGYYLSDALNIYKGPNFPETKSFRDIAEAGEYLDIEAIVGIRP